jgi:hypothetical protein
MIEEQPWEVEFTDQFEGWWDRLSESQQDALTERVLLLAAVGPSLGRPAVDQIKSSRHQNMKELRTSSLGQLRVLFAFDPLRHAILLIGGNKSGEWQKWYSQAIPVADDLFDEHLREFLDIDDPPQQRATDR